MVPDTKPCTIVRGAHAQTRAVCVSQLRQDTLGAVVLDQDAFLDAYEQQTHLGLRLCDAQRWLSRRFVELFGTVPLIISGAFATTPDAYPYLWYCRAFGIKCRLVGDDFVSIDTLGRDVLHT